MGEGKAVVEGVDVFETCKGFETFDAEVEEEVDVGSVGGGGMEMGYCLFAANPLGERIYTNRKSEQNLALKKGERVYYRYRILINNDARSLSDGGIEQFKKAFYTQ